MIDKKTFSIKRDGKEIKLAIRRPTVTDNKQAQTIYNTELQNALKRKAILRQKLDDYLVEQGIWDDDKQTQLISLRNELLRGERQLLKGGKNLRVSEASSIAFRLIKVREEINKLLLVKLELDSMTAQGQAENSKLNYLVYACLVYDNTGDTYFKTYDEYLKHTDGDGIISLATQYFLELQYGINNQKEQEKLPEYKFLRKFGFVDEKFRRVNKEGHLVDDDGRLIDEDGNYIKYVDGQKVYVDIDGYPVNKDGEYDFEFEGFIDDETGELVGVEIEDKPKKRASKSKS